MASLSNTDDGRVDVEIDLTLEEWGRIALIAHKNNLTINDTIEMVLTGLVERLKQEEESNDQENND